MSIKIGATSYVFRYLLADVARAPRIADLLAVARDAGLERLQVCENARPLESSCSEWESLRTRSDGLGLDITLGSMTTDLQVVAQYLDRVEAIGGSQLRIVLEREGGGRISRGEVHEFLSRVVPHLERRGVRLAIENHFDIPCRILAEAVAEYPKEAVGFCLDVANSLRNFEDLDTVFDLLGSRALMYHLKDYRLTGSNVGFAVTGTPFGEGQIERRKLLQRIFEHTETPEMYLETWTPQTGDWETDVASDARFVAASVRNLKKELATHLPQLHSRQVITNEEAD
jgi:sugar phosphate isomerase/epimerase